MAYSLIESTLKRAESSILDSNHAANSVAKYRETREAC